MDIDQVIDDFSDAYSDLPVEAINWALGNWEVAAPRFKRHLEDLANGSLTGPKATSAALFIVHLLGEKREASAFATLCAFLKHPELADEALGDAITSTLRNVLIAAFDGEPRTLQSLVECDAADEFVRGAALEALAFSSFSGATPGLEMRAYMLELRERMQPREASPIWTAWAIEAAHLGYADFSGEVEALLNQGFIEEGIMTPKDFANDVARTLGDPTRRAGFAFDNVEPFTDTIGELSQWYGFSKKPKIEEPAHAAPRWEPSENLGRLLLGFAPVVNPMRHVGRNDPCPCGSGKKYKKCCLAA